MRIVRAGQGMRAARSTALALMFALALPFAALASPTEYLTVGDPLEAELRALDALGPVTPGQPIRLPRMGMRPLQRFELDSLPHPEAAGGVAHRISLVRLWRALARDNGKDVPGTTPRLYQRHYGDGARFEMSAGAEGGAHFEADRVRWRPGTGLHARVALETDRWLAYSHLSAGYQDTASSYGDPIFSRTNLIAYTDESYLAYNSQSRRWGIQFGRGHWHWGPGDESSLLLSRTSVALTGLAFHARLEALKADGMSFCATLAPAQGEQLAAHRLEWQLRDGLRVGIAEAARYRSAAWQPLYVLGVIPYIIVQRILYQDEASEKEANRNNTIISADISWRVAAGTRLYGEFLADDLHLGVGRGYPNQYAYQLGLDGVGTFRSTRVVWNGEYTRASRFVYTSAFGRTFVAQSRPLGFPGAPDARRMRVRAAWDLSPAWQVLASATRQEHGENTLFDPFLPDSPSVDASRFEGVVEETRELETGLRWWPASGIDLSVAATYRWVDNVRHVVGIRERHLGGSVAFRLVR